MMKQLIRLGFLALVIVAGVLGYGTLVPLARYPRHAAIIPVAAPRHNFQPASAQRRLTTAYGQMPLGFEVNIGQTSQPVKFIARGSGYNLFLTGHEAVLSLRSRPSSLVPHPLTPAVLRMSLLGANRQAPIVGAQKLAGVSNYFLGHDPRQWHTGVARYGRVKYAGIYPGVDLVYYGNQRQLEYDFIVAPGADPTQIRLGFAGAQQAQVDKSGDLVLRLKDGTIQWHKPVIYQNIKGHHRPITGAYQLKTQNSKFKTHAVSFRLAAYDHRQPLIIDPTLSYSTYLGGTGPDQANAIAVDSSGNAYITGLTNPGIFPTLNPLQASNAGKSDAFVTKLNAAGALVYSTYLGGNDDDQANGIAVDAAGDAYITGQTKSTNFPIAPLSTAYQTSNAGGQDAFVTELSATGGALVYSTYLGGSGSDGGNGIAVDSSGSAYVTGVTGSSNFLGGIISLLFGGGNDAFVTKFNPAGTATLYSTYVGGSGNDSGNGIAVDSGGNAYIVGTTDSTDLPTNTSANFSSRAGGTDAFVAKLNAAGSSQTYALYLGGSGNDTGTGIAVDSGGDAYVTGTTSSTNFPTKTPLQASNAGGNDAFVTEINSAGSNTVASTYLGGSNNDTATAIALDGSGNAHVVGLTNSSNFPLKNASQAAFGGGPNDAFVTVLNASLATLVDSTYLGGTGNDQALGIAADAANSSYVAGLTDSNNFTTLNAAQPAHGGGPDAFVAKFATVIPTLTLAVNPTTFSEAAGTGAATGTVTLNVVSSSPVTVALTSSDTTKATVPATVAIPANATSATFAINAVDNLVVDGDKTVNITATSGGFTGANQSVLVVDNDVPTLTLNLTATTFSEAAGANAVTGTVTRNTSTAAPLVVTLSSSNTNKATVPTTVTIPTGATSATFVVAAVDNTIVDGATSVTLTAGATGYTGATATVNVTDNDVPTLTLTVAPTTFSEGAGANAAVGTIVRNTSTVGALTVNLTSSNPNKATVPATVTIPDGVAAATFAIGVVDNNLVDGDKIVTISATRTGYTAAAATVTVTDNDTPQLSLSVTPASFSEGAGAKAATGTVSRNTSTATALNVTLSTTEATSTQFLTSVTIPTGASSANFTLGVVDDNIAQGNRVVTLTAAAAGLASAAFPITIIDNDTPALSLNVSPNTFAEGQNKPVVGTVTRNTPTTAPLIVSLVSSNTAKATLPATVVIPAGAAIATFAVTPIDNNIVDGPINVTFTATATGLTSASQTVTVTDNDGPTLTLTISATTFSEAAGANAATGIVTRNTSTAAPLTVFLSSDTPTKIQVPAAVVIPSGAASATFSITTIDDGLATGATAVEIKAAAPGFNSVSQLLIVTDNEVPTLTLNITPSTFSEKAGAMAAVGTVTRNTATDTALQVSLTSSNTNQARVPTSVIIPKGAAKVTFWVAAIDDMLVDGANPVTITATAQFVTDNARARAQSVALRDKNNVAFVPGVAVITVLNADVSAPTPTPLPTATPQPGATPTPVATPSQGATPTPLPGATPTPKPGATPTPKPRPTATPKPGVTPTPKPRPTATPKPGATPTPKPGGTPTPGPTPKPSVTPTPVALTPLTAWGFNGFGQVGDNTTVNRALPQPVMSAGVFLAVGAGGSHTLAIRSDGTVWAWGFNQYGELGDGTTINRRTPVAVPGLASVRAVAAGWYHSIALKSDGTVWAWGYNGRGQLGDGSTTDRHAPIPVRGLARIVAIAAGVYHNIALRDDGTVWTWGDNKYGELGDGTTTQRNLPTPVPGLTGVTSIAAGATHTLVALRDGGVRAWGRNQYGQLGDGTNNDSASPVQTVGLARVTAVAAGYVHSLALAGGQVRAWGSNQYGQLGDGTTKDSKVPVTAHGLAGVRALAVGTGHNLALLTDGTVWAWGWNLFGQLGNGTRRDNALPQCIPHLAGIQAIATGYAHSVALGSVVTPVATFAAPIFSRGVAQAQLDDIQLFFSHHLAPESASDTATYVITINGHAVTVESASYNGSNGCVTLGLAAGDLRVGDKVIVSWHNLQSLADTVAVDGQTGPLLAR